MSGELGRGRAPGWVRAVTVLLVVAITALVMALTTRGRPTVAPQPGPAPAPLSAEWVDGQGSVSANGVARGSVRLRGAVDPGTDLEVTLRNATFAAIPDPCLVSVAKIRHSWIAGDGRTLHCTLPRSAVGAAQPVEFTALADDVDNAFVTGTASLADGSSMRLADRPVTVGIRPETREMRLLSAPDFINADVGDLRRGDTSFRPSTETNGVNGFYRRALDMVLADWHSKKPDDVTVAGDLVDGHWGVDWQKLGVFGPVATRAERERAVTRAGDLYYSQWAARFRAHGLTNVHPAMGDHEYGDNNWPRWKLNLFDAYQSVWARHFTQRPDGTPRYADRPRGSHELSAYAWRPRPDVQMVTLDEFTSTNGSMQLRVDQQQQAWLVRVLKQANADGVRWTIVQGHLPILGPVREGGSSGLSYAGGRQSALWRIFKHYGVDVYLCGEVHDVTAIRRDGVLQLSHGGIFQFGRLNYLVADVYATHLDLTIYDYDFTRVGNDWLWETRKPIPAGVVYDPDPGIIGTAQLWADGRLARVSGALAPYTP